MQLAPVPSLQNLTVCPLATGGVLLRGESVKPAGALEPGTVFLAVLGTRPQPGRRGCVTRHGCHSGQLAAHVWQQVEFTQAPVAGSEGRTVSRGFGTRGSSFECLRTSVMGRLLRPLDLDLCRSISEERHDPLKRFALHLRRAS